MIAKDTRKRPQQDSNLRTQLRRAIPFRSLTCTDSQGQPLLGHCEGAGPAGRRLVPQPLRSAPLRRFTGQEEGLRLPLREVAVVIGATGVLGGALCVVLGCS